MDHHERKAQAYIDKVGIERYTIECLIAHMTEDERNRLLLDLPHHARECFERVIRETEPG